MAITKFRWGMGGTDESAGFGKKVWFKRTTDPADVEEFATRESSEEQVRKDYQNLFNQLQWYINEKLTNEIELYAKQIAEQAVEEAGWQAAIPDGTITAAKLASNAAETAKIKDGAVTSAKIASGAVETAKIADSAVTAAKIGETVPVAKGGTGVTTLAALKTAMGLGGVVKAEIGSYVGAGHYGSDNKTSVTLQHKPFLFCVIGMEPPMTPESPESYVRNGHSQYAATVWRHLIGTYTESTKTFSWYSDGGNSGTQLDQSGKTYHYFALYTE